VHLVRGTQASTSSILFWRHGSQRSLRRFNRMSSPGSFLIKYGGAASVNCLKWTNLEWKVITHSKLGIIILFLQLHDVNIVTLPSWMRRFWRYRILILLYHIIRPLCRYFVLDILLLGVYFHCRACTIRRNRSIGIGRFENGTHWFNLILYLGNINCYIIPVKNI